MKWPDGDPVTFGDIVAGIAGFFFGILTMFLGAVLVFLPLLLLLGWRPW